MAGILCYKSTPLLLLNQVTKLQHLNLLVVMTGAVLYNLKHEAHDKLGIFFLCRGLFLKNSAPVPDTCVRIRRQLVKRAINPSAAPGLSNASTTDSNTVKSSPVIETGVVRLI